MEIADLLPGPDAVLASVKASGKKALLAELASRAASVFKFDERRLFDRLLEEMKEKNFSGMVWQVLDWNEPAIQFYKKYKAGFDAGWINCSVEA